MSEFHNMDCMQGMKGFADNHFDLAIVDPPYGIGADKMTLGNGHKKIYRGGSSWDESAPPKEYFNELLRVSKNQIIWGANHFLGWCSPCWVVWDKGTGDNDYADCELAYTSFKKPVRKFFKSWVGANAKDGWKRIHPTQKPVALYKWLLHNYAKEGDKILDTHVGSASSLIACEDMHFDYVGYELDKDYYQAATKRLNNHKAQLKIF